MFELECSLQISATKLLVRRCIDLTRLELSNIRLRQRREHRQEDVPGSERRVRRVLNSVLKTLFPPATAETTALISLVLDLQRYLRVVGALNQEVTTLCPSPSCSRTEDAF